MSTPFEDSTADLVVGCFRMWVHGRQFEAAEDYWDGNWLDVTAEATAAGAQVRAAGPLVHLGELVRFATECRRLHETLDGEAELACMEPNIRVKLQGRGRGHMGCEISITPDHMTQRHEFVEDLDQTHLPAILLGIQDVLRRFPVRGRPPQRRSPDTGSAFPLPEPSTGGHTMTQLPTDQQRAPLCELVADAFVWIRLWAREAGHCHIEDLADAFHDLPREMFGWGNWDPQRTRGMLVDFASKHGLQGIVQRFDEVMGKHGT